MVCDRQRRPERFGLGLGDGEAEARSGGAIEDSIRSLLRIRRNIGPDKGDDFSILDIKQISDTLSGTTKTLSSIVTAVAAISLLVGGIGICSAARVGRGAFETAGPGSTPVRGGF
jgi:hypothetical protein